MWNLSATLTLPGVHQGHSRFHRFHFDTGVSPSAQQPAAPTPSFRSLTVAARRTSCEGGIAARGASRTNAYNLATTVPLVQGAGVALKTGKSEARHPMLLCEVAGRLRYEAREQILNPNAPMTQTAPQP